METVGDIIFKLFDAGEPMRGDGMQCFFEEGDNIG